ncbi:hypothetical protein [Streptomyces aurantiogriseus]|uniref:Uncharacterized protein n=1 Tax=Streptomyces aurantiogriseus TaxID=66870 RepID=A0A918C4K1_9ACTN|nr:hypothetical protein [Streptomyces aurantiogriseus]GGR06884.1 hypothetical protein GCM10010251_23330 [Streptomyces aurantiogriseus]
MRADEKGWQDLTLRLFRSVSSDLHEPGGRRGVRPDHFSITITADTYTSRFPEADLAIAEAAARLVPRARATSENTPPTEEPEPADAFRGVSRPHVC